MTQIEFNDTCSYTESLKLITISEKHVTKFDSNYRLWNPVTQHGKVFEFSHTTGPEFDPNTSFIFKSDDGLTLEIVNDPETTEARKQLYINSKSL